MVALLVFGVGCQAPEVPDAVDPGAAAPKPDLYLALSGGGWRTHTAHAGWTIGLLDNQATGPQQKLMQVFGHVDAVSSNSGGSWFNTMITFSPEFRQRLEARNVASTYLTDTSGYFQSEKTILQAFPATTSCDLWSSWPQLYFMCVVGNGVGASLDWDKLIQDVVFGPFGMATKLKSTTLGGGPRQPWANGKALLLAATMLNNEAVMTGSLFGDKYFYNAPDLGPLDVVPVTFSDIAPPAGPVFLPSAPASFEVTYGDTNPTPVALNNHGNLDSSAIDVVTAAAASSAASGFVASRGINENNGSFLAGIPLTDWQISYEASSLALYFNLPDPADPKAPLTRSSTPPTSNNDTNARSRFVQIADGGPLDNSGVAQMVAFHQKKHGTTKTPFSIVAFDNVQDTYTPDVSGRKYAPVGVDIAALFGEGLTDLGNGKKGFCTAADATSNGYCITVVDSKAKPPVSLQVFDSAGIKADDTWKHVVDAKHRLVYTQYSVTTVDSPLMGVKGGWTGTIHAFTCQWSNASTAPWTTSSGGKLGDEDWKAYEKMFEAIQTGVKTKGGLTHLRSALGL